MAPTQEKLCLGQHGIHKEACKAKSGAADPTRALALIGDPDAMAYEVLLSFSSQVEKERFLDLIRSNDDLGNEYIKYDLIEPVKDEIRNARPLSSVLPQAALTRALLVATSVSSSILHRTIQ